MHLPRGPGQAKLGFSPFLSFFRGATEPILWRFLSTCLVLTALLILGLPAFPAASAGLTNYTVKAGDTLYDIALKFGMSVDDMVALNGIDDPDMLAVGQELYLTAAQITYVVKEGDTLSDIAEAFGTTAEELVKLNYLENSDLIQVGQELTVPIGTESNYSASDLEAQRLKLVWPTVGNITTYFGEPGRQWRLGWHTGIDIGNDYGTPIYAAESGTVIRVVQGYNNGYGWTIVIEHLDNYTTLYAHLNAIYVEVGEEVDRWQVIGTMGSTGYSTGPHLHFELEQNGTLLDPLRYLP